MKALIIYVLLVLAGALLAGFIGSVIETNYSSTLGLIVFLTMFFANFAICWMLTVLIMDGTLKNWSGERPALPKRA